jgi:hypothetical protein
MRSRVFYTVCVLICLVALPVFSQTAADPVTGTWSGDWGPTATHEMT